MAATQEGVRVMCDGCGSDIKGSITAVRGYGNLCPLCSNEFHDIVSFSGDTYDSHVLSEEFKHASDSVREKAKQVPMKDMRKVFEGEMQYDHLR